MVLINKAVNEVTVKLVYYGPGLCGKTTNLEKIYANPKIDQKGKMISMATETDRTLFFDFMPLELGTIGGNKVRVQIYTVPGQVFYDATRKLVLRGADGVVFVADSQASMRDSNLQSLDNLKTNLRLNRLDPERIAMVFQYNKRDLPSAMPVEQMNADLEPGDAPVVEAIALQGAGVTATFRAAVSRILENMKNGVDITLYEAKELKRPDLSVGSGTTATSAGIPKISVAAKNPVAATPAQEPPPPVAPMEASPFFDASTATVDEMPFSIDEPASPFEPIVDLTEEAEYDSPLEHHLSAAEPAAAPPAAAPPPDAAAATSTSDAILARARELVESLERALEAARAHERELRDRLGR